MLNPPSIICDTNLAAANRELRGKGLRYGVENDLSMLVLAQRTLRIG